MINLRNITLRHGAKILLENVNWTIYPRQRIGLIGANGAGKTSLFSLLLGHAQADQGNLEIGKQVRLAHLAQETPSYQQSALDYVLDGDQVLRSLEQQLVIAEEKNELDKIVGLHEKLAVHDAYTAKSRAAKLLVGLGFAHQDQEKNIADFSGGWRVRLNLARALMCPSDVLLLDEPTNHLDLDALLWLEQWLTKYPGTLLIISHDREFLDKTVDHIAHLYQQQLKLYTGNYSTFEKTRASHLLLQQAAFEKQQRQLSHMQSYVDRFRYKASKAKQAQSRLKAIEKIDLICAVQTESPFSFEFKQPDACSNPMLTLEKASLSYGDKVILNQIDFNIMAKDRIAILGPNGAGKSSFIKMLTGDVALNTGVRTLSANLKIGYFAQHQVDHLHLSDSPFLHLRRLAQKESETDLRKYLGGFGFSGDTVFEPVEKFSGGEKSRLALALIIWQKPNLLLLDEPTNHLDLEMRNALSLALQEYEGSMILVSHDRFLVKMTTDNLLLIADGQLQPFTGDLDDYQKWLLDYRKNQSSGEASEKLNISKKGQRQLEAKARENRRPLLDKIKKYETQLEKLQKNSKEIEDKLSDAALYEDTQKQNLQALLQKKSDLDKEIAQIEEAWLLACEARDKSE